MSTDFWYGFVVGMVFITTAAWLFYVLTDPRVQQPPTEK